MPPSGPTRISRVTISTMAPTTIDSLILKRDCKYTDGYHCYAIPQAAVAGIVVGSAAILLALLSALFIFVKWRKRAKKRKLGEERTQGDIMRYMGSERHESISFNPNAY